MANYLKFHNSQINEQAIVDACNASNPKPLKVKVPDIISHRFSRREFYEIKPRSVSGLQSGAEKIAWFSALCNPLPFPNPPLLPYLAGTQYTPDFTHILASGGALGAPFRIGIHIFRPPVVPGLILYELCPTTTRPTQDRCATALIRGAGVMTVLRLRHDTIAAETVVASLVRLAQSPLQAAVGRPNSAGAAPNIREDVEYLQVLLNDWRDRRGLSLIAEDGLWQFTGETDTAIIDVQQEIFAGSDGRIDPNGVTVGALEEGHMRGVFAAAEAAIAETPLPEVDGSIIFHDPDEDQDDDGDVGISPEVLILSLETEMRDYLGILYPPRRS
jgi:hypothetical protein